MDRSGVSERRLSRSSRRQSPRLNGSRRPQCSHGRSADEPLARSAADHPALPPPGRGWDPRSGLDYPDPSRCAPTRLDVPRRDPEPARASILSTAPSASSRDSEAPRKGDGRSSAITRLLFPAEPLQFRLLGKPHGPVVELLFVEHGRIVPTRVAPVTPLSARKARVSDGTGRAEWSLGALRG